MANPIATTKRKYWVYHTRKIYGSVIKIGLFTNKRAGDP